MNLFFSRLKSFYFIIFISLFLFASNKVIAQQTQISGKFLDSKDNSTLVGVGVMLLNKKDTTKTLQTSTDIDGKFIFYNVPKGNYKLRAFYVGYKRFESEIIVTGTNQQMGPFKLVQSITKLKDIVVEENAIRSTQKNDTIEYNAKADQDSWNDMKVFFGRVFKE